MVHPTIGKKDEDKDRKELLDQLAVLREKSARLEAFIARSGIRPQEKTEVCEPVSGKLSEYEQLADLAQVMIRDTTGRILLWSSGMERLYGYSRGEASGRITHDLLQTVFPISREAMETVLEKTGQWQGELIHTAKDGHKVIVASHQVLYREPGKPSVILESNNDITQLRRADEALSESRELLAISQEIARLGSWVWDIPEDKQVWSDERYRVFGMKPGEILPTYQLYLSFVHPEDRSMVDSAIKTAIQVGKPFNIDYRIIRKDGNLLYMHSEGYVTYDDRGKPCRLYAIGQDVTERRQIEQRLADQATQLQEQANILDLAHVMILDLQRRIVLWNSGMKALYGYSKAEALGRISDQLLQTIFPVSVEAFNEAMEKTGHWQGELIHTAKDGRKIVVASHQVMYYEACKPVVILEVNNDITEQKRLEQALREAKNRAELYLDIMGHDINNLNQIALGNLELIQGDSNLTQDQADILADALNSVRGSASIIDNVRKIQAITEEQVPMMTEDLNDLIQECIEAAPRLENQVVVINYTPRSHLMIRGTALMKEVFSNLINNAIKHSGHDVTIDIGIDETTHRGKKVYNVAIADNGPGIPDSLKPKLFNRFQRGNTKAHGKGLGLYIVKSLVEQAGGDVVVTDRVRGDYTRGAKFIVSLPACEDCI